uniref:Uncharacterized protein n=1 Tax=Solanum lycopersicum TaxID=4081 RepID=A0A3Q7GLR7_SOLLC
IDRKTFHLSKLLWGNQQQQQGSIQQQRLRETILVQVS